jgi:hypothetical protein
MKERISIAVAPDPNGTARPAPHLVHGVLSVRLALTPVDEVVLAAPFSDENVSRNVADRMSF